MASDPIFRHLMQEFFPYSFEETSDSLFKFNQKFTPKGPLSKNLLNLIAEAFLAIETVVHETWARRLAIIQRSMMQSAELYICHLMCICFTEQQIVTDIYDLFLNVIVLVRYITRMIFYTTGKKLFKLASRILTVFFENSLREDFMKHGGWERLEKHILNRKYHEYYNECARYDFITESIPQDLKEKIRPSLSFSNELPEYINVRITDLTRKVISSVESSLLNEISSPKSNKEISVSKEAEGASSTEANVLKDSDMPRSSEKQINLCESRLNQLEEKLKGLISIFELLETE
ncbi:uncharacterized protein TNIN_161311 [Trichonephila inaurata madagascariensis]|uniref:Uncharacterized protein n=1 Tax=Trichonephila inaurata madagascariensis TaxID=2747483 RepID=A0A8X6XDY4_9ARAC|nr:uncharacterized protein TNIN_161311 [Trichonephila inaurata madagascariensis]